MKNDETYTATIGKSDSGTTCNSVISRLSEAYVSGFDQLEKETYELKSALAELEYNFNNQNAEIENMKSTDDKLLKRTSNLHRRLLDIGDDLDSYEYDTRNQIESIKYLIYGLFGCFGIILVIFLANVAVTDQRIKEIEFSNNTIILDEPMNVVSGVYNNPSTKSILEIQFDKNSITNGVITLYKKNKNISERFIYNDEEQIYCGDIISFEYIEGKVRVYINKSKEEYQLLYQYEEN